MVDAKNSATSPDLPATIEEPESSGGPGQAVLDLLSSLSCPRKGLIGPWSHRYPEEGTPGPAFDFRAECVRWWDHWLKGEDTGVLDEPVLHAWMPGGAAEEASILGAKDRGKEQQRRGREKGRAGPRPAAEPAEVRVTASWP